MAVFLAPIINGQQFDANGNPLNAGKIHVYLAGTTTAATTYTNQGAGTPNANPIILNTLGVNASGDVWLTSGSEYKFVVKDSADVTLRTIDDVTGVNDNTVTADQWTLYAAAPTYVSATSFTVAGDQTGTFQVGRRLKSTNTGGTVYSTIIRSVFGTSTTVTVINDSSSLDSGLSAVSTGLLTAQDVSLPGTLNAPAFRNRIINGALRIDQRNGGAAQTLTAAAAVAYTVDRFYASCTGANSTIQQIAGTGYRFAVRITGAASVTATLFGQRIEAGNCYDWASKQVNVQIPISATNLTTLTWNAYTADVADVWSAKTLLATGSLTISTTVETKYFSFNAGAGAVRGVAIEFVTGAIGAGQTITYQGAVQAEVGQVSNFETVDIAEEILRCKRTYRTGAGKLGGYAGSAGVGHYYHIAFDTDMRATPTLGYGAGTTTNVTTYDAREPSTLGLLWYCTATGAGGLAWTGTWTASAEL